MTRIILIVFPMHSFWSHVRNRIIQHFSFITIREKSTSISDYMFSFFRLRQVFNRVRVLPGIPEGASADFQQYFAAFFWFLPLLFLTRFYQFTPGCKKILSAMEQFSFYLRLSMLVLPFRLIVLIIY